MGFILGWLVDRFFYSNVLLIAAFGPLAFFGLFASWIFYPPGAEGLKPDVGFFDYLLFLMIAIPGIALSGFLTYSALKAEVIRAILLNLPLDKKEITFHYHWQTLKQNGFMFLAIGFMLMFPLVFLLIPLGSNLTSIVDGHGSIETYIFSYVLLLVYLAMLRLPYKLFYLTSMKAIVDKEKLSHASLTTTGHIKMLDYDWSMQVNNAPTHYTLVFTFTIEDGTTYKAETRIPYADGFALQNGATLKVRYSPEDPSVYELNIS